MRAGEIATGEGSRCLYSESACALADRCGPGAWKRCPEISLSARGQHAILVRRCRLLPKEDWKAMRTAEYLVYAPRRIIEVRSPSNPPKKIQFQRLAAFSGGTVEFRVVDPVAHTVEVSLPGKPSRLYSEQETVPVAVLPGVHLPVHTIFEE